jgi:hypothetical protein
MYVQYTQGLFQSRLGTADYALVTSSLRYNEDEMPKCVFHNRIYETTNKWQKKKNNLAVK